MQLILDLPDCDAAVLTSFLAWVWHWEQAHPQVTILTNVYAPTPSVPEAQALLRASGLAHAQVLPVPDRRAPEASGWWTEDPSATPLPPVDLGDVFIPGRITDDPDTP